MSGDESISCALIVSRGTPAEAKLRRYAEMLVEWNEKMNLVAASTIPHLWERHFLDSAQVMKHLPENAQVLVDMGTGAGFPGLVLAILGVPEVHLVESVGKKVTFLRAVVEALGLQNVTLHQERVEKLRGIAADVVTARAMTALPQLISYAKPLLKPSGMAVFLKGVKADVELTEARKYWTFSCSRFASETDADSAILKISDIRILHGHDRSRRSSSRRS